MASGAAGPPLGATEVFYADFFPSLSAWLHRAGTPLAQRFLPAPLPQCPEPVTLILGHAFRNIGLVPHQLAGLAVGFCGAAALRRHRAGALLELSFLFFALMHLSSLVAHGVAQRGGAGWLACIAVDIGCTGASSLCLACHQVPALRRLARGRAAALGWATALAAVAACWLALVHSWPWVAEAFYLGTTAVAAAATFWGELLRGRLAAKAAGLALALAGLALMVGGLPADPLLCSVFGPSFGTTHALFLGCDLGFAGLLLVALAGGGRRAGKAKRP